MSWTGDRNDEGAFVLVGGGSTRIDEAGFSLRRRGVEVRDCIAVQRPGGPSFVLVGQVPTDQTFVEQVVRGKGSVLDIDASRISYLSDKDKTREVGKGVFQKEPGVGSHFPHHKRNWGKWSVSDGGRFPSNTILQHGPGCYVAGTKKIKGITGTAAGKMKGDLGDSKTYGLRTKEGATRWHGAEAAGSQTGYVDEDGNEEVPNWICEQGCPVAMMDAQSGTSKSPTTYTRKVGTDTAIYGKGLGRYPTGYVENNYGDEGGASRFFKQVRSEADLEAYLDSLVRGT